MSCPTRVLISPLARLISLTVLCACSSTPDNDNDNGNDTDAGTDASTEQDVAAPRENHYALVIGIDGVRSDAFELASTPNIDRLSDEGAWTLDASTQLEADTMSGPGWTSILTGVDADKHLVDGNNDLGELFRNARANLGLAASSPQVSE